MSKTFSVADTPYSAQRHALQPGSLASKLVELRHLSADKPVDARLATWARAHLAIDTDSEADWCRRAWWGLAAGELVRVYLYDEWRHAEALMLADSADWRLIDEAAQCSGVILTAAHLGPPKYAMNYVLAHCDRPLIWTNTKDMPNWLRHRPGVSLLNPAAESGRAEVLVKSALHLRGGGVLFGAPDGAHSTRHITISAYRKSWPFSPGLPMLARRLALPVFALTALWRGERIHLAVQPLNAPPQYLSDDAWTRAWVEDYWQSVMSPVIAASPENLRFLLYSCGHPYRLEFET